MLPNRAGEFGHPTVAALAVAAEDLETARLQEARMTPVETKPARRSKAAANKAALREAIAALNADGAEEYLALFRPDAKLHDFPSGIEDVDDLCRFHAATAHTYPDSSVVLEDAIAEGERVATRFTWRASQGPGLELVAQGGAIVRFADGQIAECWNLPAEIHAVAS
jgi:predicted SnoaL-like aldol condensation-catalyzing enzyme